MTDPACYTIAAAIFFAAAFVAFLRPNDTRIGDALHRIADQLERIAKSLNQNR